MRTRTWLGVVVVVLSGVVVAARESYAPDTLIVRLRGNEFVPRTITAHAGDTIRFVNGNGGPHNVAFAKDSIAAAARDLIDGAMKDRIGPLIGPLLLDPEETYRLVVPALAPGRYPYFCLPHQDQMRAVLIVTRDS